MACKPLKEGDVLFSIPADMPHVVSFGYDNHTLLRFCVNHLKPFGFLWQPEFRHAVQCPKCGDGFIPDEARTFVRIKTGYTISQRFYSVTTTSNSVLDSEYIDG